MIEHIVAVYSKDDSFSGWKANPTRVSGSIICAAFNGRVYLGR